MTATQFIETFRLAFGDMAPLPIAFGYSTQPAAPVMPVARCMIGSISNVRHGDPLTLTAHVVKCGGGGLYTGFKPMSEHIPNFVSQVEHYKRTPQQVVDYVEALDIVPAPAPYLNFIRMDQLTSFDGIDGILFWGTPDIISGLCAWAYYDNNDPHAVSAQFGSGCSSIVSFAVKENRDKGRSCFLGMLDPSARPLIPKNEMSFVIPINRFMEMMETMKDSALFQHAFSIIRKRINGEIQKD